MEFGECEELADAVCVRWPVAGVAGQSAFIEAEAGDSLEAERSSEVAEQIDLEMWWLAAVSVGWATAG